MRKTFLAGLPPMLETSRAALEIDGPPEPLRVAAHRWAARWAAAADVRRRTRMTLDDVDFGP